MTRKLRTLAHSSIPALAFSAILAPAAFPQQSNFQTSFLTPASVRTPPSVIAADIAEIEHLSYLSQVTKEQKTVAGLFKPSSSDFLIQHAEDRFRNGRKFYQERNFDEARSEFDAAIDLMLSASEAPTDRPLYETRLEEMVDSIHHFDLTGMGAASEETVPHFDKAPLEDIVQMTF